MRGSILFGVAATAALFVSASAYAQDEQVSRGKYLVEQVARCPECHTPRTETGELDRARWMKGATLVIKGGEATDERFRVFAEFDTLGSRDEGVPSFELRDRDGTRIESWTLPAGRTRLAESR